MLFTEKFLLWQIIQLCDLDFLKSLEKRREIISFSHIWIRSVIDISDRNSFFCKKRIISLARCFLKKYLHRCIVIASRSVSAGPLSVIRILVCFKSPWVIWFFHSLSSNFVTSRIVLLRCIWLIFSSFKNYSWYMVLWSRNKGHEHQQFAD